MSVTENNRSRVDLAGKRALVTGAGAGIGREVAAELARRGAIVVALDRDAPPLEVLRQESQESAGEIHPYELNLADTEHFPDLITWMENKFGGLDIIANVAGITRWRPWDEVTLDDWEDIFAVNARAVFFLTQQAVPLMQKAGGGSVTSIASIAGKGFRRTSSVAYAGSKAAVIAMSRVLSDSLAPYDIRVNCLCPGPVETGFLREGMNIFAERSGDSSDSEHQQWVEQVPLRRAAQPIDIADAICFLAADTGRCITGQAWNIDGGMVFD